MGVSARGANPGRIILDNLLRSDGPVKGDLHVVHPKEESIAGVKCVPDVASLPAKVPAEMLGSPNLASSSSRQPMRSASTCRARATAMGLRQVLPVQTNRTVRADICSILRASSTPARRIL